MIRRTPRSTLFPTRRSSDLIIDKIIVFILLFSFIKLCFGKEKKRLIITKLNILTPAKDLKLLILDRKSTRLNSSHVRISYAVFCLKKKKNTQKKKTLTL